MKIANLLAMFLPPVQRDAMPNEESGADLKSRITPY